ncbi:50S ribosomal protein L7/L12 [Candidatus Tremblaya princeps]|uniref:Large ribosomal subunit protein bL12 n=1 Tax=Tremblaya princeps TaxID=189385 RepID=A0A1C3K947_TREPR|nr:50S ribosomal protein L7/L12 [Candidatus Tremblaya princeps]SBT63057.1 50S ribosomal protein L7/L12 [Candidatus Tremblaya princeps]
MSNDDIVSRIAAMTALELSDLVALLEQRFQISRLAQAPCQPGSKSDEAEPDRRNRKVFLTNAGSNKIAVIRAVRDVTKLGLKESKGLVDSVPSLVAEGLSADEAEEIRSKVEAAGARAEVR